MNPSTAICVLVVITTVGVGAFTEEQLKRLQEYSKECKPISNVDEKLVGDALKGIYSDDPALKKHAFCFAKKAKVENENGELIPDVIRGRLNAQIEDKSEVENLMKKCVVQKDDPENTAWDMLKCFLQNLPKDVAVF